MNKKYRFKKLSSKAKVIAATSYHEDLIQNRNWHDDEEDCLTIAEAYDCCIDSNLDVWYDKNGNLIEMEDYE